MLEALVHGNTSDHVQSNDCFLPTHYAGSDNLKQVALLLVLYLLHFVYYVYFIYYVYYVDFISCVYYAYHDH